MENPATLYSFHIIIFHFHKTYLNKFSMLFKDLSPYKTSGPYTE